MPNGPTDLLKGTALGTGHAFGKALGEASIKKAKELLATWENHQNGFLGEEARTDIKGARRLGIFEEHRKFFSEKKQEKCFLAGFYLRKIAADQPRVKAYRKSLRSLFGPNGVHIAQAVQANIVGEIRTALEAFYKPTEFHNHMVAFFQNVDSYVLFVEDEDTAEYEIERLRKHLKLNGPPVFVVAASGDPVSLARDIAHTVKQRLDPEYGLRTIEESGGKVCNFVLYMR